MALKATLSEAKSLKRQNDTENELQVIQFNCNSLLNKLPEIKLYIYTKKPEIVCLCETFIKKGSLVTTTTGNTETATREAWQHS